MLGRPRLPIIIIITVMKMSFECHSWMPIPQLRLNYHLGLCGRSSRRPTLLRVVHYLFAKRCYRAHDRRLMASKLSIWQIGDTVQIPNNTTTMMEYGIVRNVVNGWYTIELSSSEKWRKYRAGHLQSIPSSDEREKRKIIPQDESTRRRDDDDDDECVTRVMDLDRLLLLRNRNDHGGGTPLSTTTPESSPNKWDWEQLQYFSYATTWVVFSDLHCSVASIDTCVAVLRQVHRIAQQQSAGLLFLGDFWHVRSHTIRIDLLHRILLLLKSFHVPMIMIPGNHDQISSSSSSSSSSISGAPRRRPPPQPLHSLTPFQNAYRIPIHNATKSSVNGVLILDEPTKFMNALFLPHERNPVLLEAILREACGVLPQSPKSPDHSSMRHPAADAIFCHVDVTGASMNDNIVSRGGISITAFPPKLPIYSGHFHKPHNVTSHRDDNAIRVEYIGSPYQVSLSESQQNKSILILNATNGWECIDRIPIRLGRRHYRPPTIPDFLSLQVATTSNLSDHQTTNDGPMVLQKGDRVVVTVEKPVMDQFRSLPDASSNPLDEHVTRLRHYGVAVEIREMNTLPSQPETRSSDSDADRALETLASLDRVDMSPSNLWSLFISQQVERGVISPTNEAKIRSKGKEIMDEVAIAGVDMVTATTSELMSNSTNEPIAGNFQLFSVSLRGFGPFYEKVTYPLFNRGLVLLRGSNRDGGSDSNGSGKTSLAMSILWAFTGMVDPRPLQDSKVVDVINDAAKSASVTVEGAINGIKFSIARTKTSSRGSLAFVLDDIDVTRQSIKDTQDMINEKLGISPQVLARTIFNGQHALNELLEASDTRLKDELSLVVPLSSWQDALQLSRQKLRDTVKRTSELDGMISVRSDDAAKLKARFEEADSAHRTESKRHEVCRMQLDGEILSISATSTFPAIDDESCALDFKSLEQNVANAANAILDIEHELRLTVEDRLADLKELEQSVDNLKSQSTTLDAELQLLTAEYNKVLLSEAVSKNRIVRLQEMWNLDLSGGMPDPFSLPQNCPTCHQPIASRNQHDGHTHLESTVRNDVEENLSQLSDLRSSLGHVQEKLKVSNFTKLMLTDDITNGQSIVDEKRRKWDDTITCLENRLYDARQVQQEASLMLTEAAKKVNEQSKVASLRTKIVASKELLDQAAGRADRALQEWKEYEQLVEELNVERSNCIELSRVMTDLCDAFGTRGIQSFIMQDAMSTLETAVQVYLDELSDGAQRLQLSLDSNDSIVRKAYVRGENGAYKERALASLSGGQWRRCSLAFTLAFADLVANRANFRPSLIVLDEPLMHLDQSGRSNVGRLLRKLLRRESEKYDTTTTGDSVRSNSSLGVHVSTILIILQDLAAEELEESFDAVDEVVKEHGVSTVFIDE